jgi:cob(I)alamin adenosyltransferase
MTEFTELGGGRVRKNDPRVEALGALDELDAFLADAQAASAPDSWSAEIIELVRKELSEKLMPLAAGISGESPAGDTERLEGWIAALEQNYLSAGFIHSWTKPLALKLNIARTVCRRAERRIIGADMGELFAYINRLSYLLFLLAADQQK